MKKYLILLVLCILCSCSEENPTIMNDFGIVTIVQSGPYIDRKYKVTVTYKYITNKYGHYATNSFCFYTNTLYSVGDTIRIHY